MDQQDSNLSQKIAVSLQYDADSASAPKVTAKGHGLIAEQIIDIAKDNNIPIQQDHDLVELLAQVELDQEIPAELYEAVAQVLVFAYQLSGKLERTSQSPETINNKNET